MFEYLKLSKEEENQLSIGIHCRLEKILDEEIEIAKNSIKLYERFKTKYIEYEKFIDRKKYELKLLESAKAKYELWMTKDE